MHRIRVASARQVLLGQRPISTEKLIKLERSFFQSVCLPNGTHKTTAPGRLKDVDQIIYEHLDNKKTVRLLDVGISSGITTIELLRHLESRHIQTYGTGVDISVRGYLTSILGVDVLRDPDGNVLQVATPFFARGRPHHSQKSIASKLLRLGMDLLESSLARKWLLNSRRSQCLNLVSPLLLGRRDFKVVEHDIAVPIPEWEASFDLIRVANVLNLDYFSPSAIAVMIENLASWLKAGGVLAICRTKASDGSNHGSLYQKQGSVPWLQHVCRFGQGHEIDEMIKKRGLCDNRSKVCASAAGERLADGEQ
jgi:SAM-dependent methyltransferase